MSEGDRDLNDLLSDEQRREFMLLVADATDRMQHSLESVFTYVAPTKEEKEIIRKAEELSIDDEKVERDEKDTQLTELNHESSDVRQPAMEYFQEWRRALLERLGTVINTKSTNKSAPRDNGSFPETEDDKLVKFPDAVSTSLDTLSAEYKTLLLNALLLLLLSLESYNAYSRTLLKIVSSSLKVPASLFLEVEGQVAAQLQKAAALEHEKSESEKQRAASSSRWKIGIASVAGAAIVGITGGLAAPLVAAGLGTVMGGIGLGGTAAASYLGAVAGSSVLIGGLFGSYGAKMAGETMRKYAAEVEDFAFLPLSKDEQTSKLSVTVGVSGWLNAVEEVSAPWTVLNDSVDGYALRYETKALLSLGTVLSDLMFSTAFAYAKKEIISRTVFAALMNALWPIGLLKIGRVLDNPWRIAFTRSQKAGVVLADALCERVQGNRPVTLIGYSLGSRVIYDCLKTLASRSKFGLVENVVVMGSPTPADAIDWKLIRSVVSGRVVNVYSENDYILGFLYRTASVQFGIAGLQEVDCYGIENVNVSHLVEGHLRYRYLIGRILRDHVGMEGLNGDLILQQDQNLKKMVHDEKKTEQQGQEDDDNEKKETIFEA